MDLHRPPRRQHTVSQVILRKFASRDTLTVYDREKDVLGPKAPRGAFRVEYFDRHDPFGAEARAGAIESRVQKVFPLIAGRTVLDHEDAVCTLIDLMALHWARSPAMRMARPD